MAIFARLLSIALSVNRLTWLLILMPTVASVLQYTVYAQFNSLVAFALALTYYGLCWQKYLLAGLVAFVTPLVVSGPTGFHISSAEAVYRFTLPVWLGLLTWPLMLGSTTARPQTNHQLQGACGD
ncbi:MAG: hypothetical protein HC875_36165 [Anaerolineales bacterium]|nr:hypothetical protein [Anaerolineales bacterium]